MTFYSNSLLKLLVILLTMIHLIGGSRKIKGGEIAQLKQFPYTVLVKVHGSQSSSHTGAIIHKDWVMTCTENVYIERTVVKVSEVSVVAGDVMKAMKGEHVQHMKATYIIRYRGYNYSDPTTNSICLIKVEKSFTFNEYVNKLKLGDDILGQEDWKTYNDCQTYGWDHFDSTQNMDDLRYFNTTVRQLRPEESVSKKLSFTEATLKGWLVVTPKVTQGTCLGDMGTSLVCNNKGIGIAIFLINPDSNIIDNKCNSDTPYYNVYYYLCPHLKWISKYVPDVPSKCLASQHSNTTYLSTSSPTMLPIAKATNKSSSTDETATSISIAVLVTLVLTFLHFSV